MTTTGQRIRDRRIALNLSVDDLAKKLGKNRATVYRYESDEIENMPLAVLTPLAEALDVTPAFLMGWKEDNNSDTAGITSDDDIKVALFGGAEEVTDEMWEEAKFAVQLIKERHRRNKEKI